MNGVEEALAAVGRLQGLEGRLVAGARHGSGHINDTYVAVYRERGVLRRYIHQRINPRVFEDPPSLVANIAAVTRHLRARLEAAGAKDIARRVLTLVPGRDGRDYVVDDSGAFWRSYLFIERTRTLEVLADEAQAFETARAFEEFQNLLCDYDGPRLRETITGFHDAEGRYQALARVLQTDPCRRLGAAEEEVAFALAHRGKAAARAELARGGGLPERIVHNDTKLNNLLLDLAAERALCVVDLDTVMPGLAFHDFGDLVRTGAVRTAEDERELSKVRLEPELFLALARGYLAGASHLH